MVKLLYIGLGGAIGTLLRYFVSGIDYRFSGGVFPFGTAAVNLIGSLIVGFLWGLFERAALSPDIRCFVFIGLLGGFTTFSTFALENFNLMRDGELKIALWNIIITNVLGIVFVFFGFWLARSWMAVSR